MWENLADFADTARQAYRRDVWVAQPDYLECWLEKDALSGIFENILENYGVTLNVGRGYDGWDSIHNAAARFLCMEDNSTITVLYFGDFDPSGEDMARSLRTRLAFFGCNPEIVKCALTREDIDLYHLPPNFTKKTDSRRAAFVREHGDIAVEIDALPPNVLRQRITDEVRARMNLYALDAVKQAEEDDRARLVAALSTM